MAASAMAASMSSFMICTLAEVVVLLLAEREDFHICQAPNFVVIVMQALQYEPVA